MAASTTPSPSPSRTASPERPEPSQAPERRKSGRAITQTRRLQSMDKTCSQPPLPSVLKHAKTKASEPATTHAARMIGILKGIDGKCNTMAQALERAETRADKAEGKIVLLEKQIETLMEVIKKQYNEQTQTYASIAGSASPSTSVTSTRSVSCNTAATSGGSVSPNSSASQQSPQALPEWSIVSQ
ncbi:hypothetical protein LTR16_000907 [Cryomyces antarcticus]|uniref:Uncharacterized protein n=1 Tax=Cryomyces antarcticus TaxID=329879 RepID=A0ABR0MAK8_9PEZI|nr:hypothetical protein LTR39_000178 [Cryomyces antarcticus]KAK5020511.1 hypothetical protein LTR60_000452 [Cryomyces antarcticus]KAK5295683.1 hypothetical protein LTR16_000907 [Cryomyces antarcticus]